MSNNLYDIIAKFNAVDQQQQPTQQPTQQPKAKTKLAENIETVEGQLNEKYMGFKKTVAAVKKGGSADNPEAVAAAIGRKKYGKEKFQKAAAQGKKLGEQQNVAENRENVRNQVMRTASEWLQDPRLETQVMSLMTTGINVTDPAKGFVGDDGNDREYPGKYSFLVSTTAKNPMYFKDFLNMVMKMKKDPRAEVIGRVQAEQPELAEEQQDESALQAYLGKKKYGEKGMKALQKAGREGASKETMAKIRAKHDKMDEVAPPGAKAERMVKHVKKGYTKDGKLSPKEKGIAYATAWKAHKAGKVEEAIAAFKILTDSGMTAEQITEGWEDMLKAVDARRSAMKPGEKRQGAKGEIEKTSTGVKHTRRYDSKTGETETGDSGEQVKRKRGRPKKSAFEQYLQQYENILEQNAPRPAPARPPAPPPTPTLPEIPTPPTRPTQPTMGTIKGGVWTADPPKKGEKGVPPPAPVNEPIGETDAPELGMGAGSRPGRVRTTEPEPEMSMGATGKAPTGPTTPAYEPKASATDLAQFQRRFHAVHTMPNYVGGHPEGELGATGNPQNKVILKKPLALDTTPSLYAMPDRHKKNESVEMQHEADDLEEMMRLAGMGEALKGGQKKLDKNKNGKLDATDFAMLRGEMEEGNEFTGALDAARDAGKKEFEVDGQTYPVKEEMDEGSEMCEGCGYTMTECGCDSSMPDQEQEGRMNVSMNVSSDGSQNLSVNAEGDQAVKLAQLLKLAGLSSGPEQVYSPVQVSMHGEHDHEHGHEEMEEAKDERYHASTTPDEQVYDLAVQLKGGNGDVAGQEKPMHKHGYKFSDNPLAMNESIAKDYASIKVAKK